MNEGKLHTKRKSFAQVSATVIHDPRLTDGDVRLYAHMLWRYGGTHTNFEGRRSMAQYLGVSMKTITNRIRNLEACGWVVVVERDLDPATKQYQTPFYHVFESRAEAKRFRATYRCAEGEAVRQKPENQSRKSRKGAGFTQERRKSKSPGNSSSHGKSEGTQVPGVGNSSSTYPYALSIPSVETTDTLKENEYYIAYKAAVFVPSYPSKATLPKFEAALNALLAAHATPEQAAAYAKTRESEEQRKGKVLNYRFEWYADDAPKIAQFAAIAPPLPPPPPHVAEEKQDVLDRSEAAIAERKRITEEAKLAMQQASALDEVLL